MRIDPNAEPPEGTTPAGSLTTVLGQSEHVKDLVDECAGELSSVNAALKQELVDGDSPSGVENALERNEAVEDKVQEASDELSAVNRALEQEITERQSPAPTEQDDAARHIAFDDPLTGLPTRALFLDRLEHGLAQAQRHGRALTVMFLDLDEFKRINDSHGHDLGDSVLWTIAGRLKAITRAGDTISRYGGDEFLYLLMEVPSERDVVFVAQRMITAIQAPCDLAVGGLRITLSVSASIGISMFPRDGTTAAALITSADKAMYRAKRAKCGHSFVL